MKQLKKSNANIRYLLGSQNSDSGLNGKIVKKMSNVKTKINKNLSQCPFNESKQNVSLVNLMNAKPYLSLVASDYSGSLSKSKDNKDRKQHQHKDKYCTKQQKLKMKKIQNKRNTLSIVDNPPKRIQNSQSNKKWVNRSVEQDQSLIKELIENRKKYNLSCNDMIETKSKCKKKQGKQFKDGKDGKYMGIKYKKKSQTNIQRSVNKPVTGLKLVKKSTKPDNDTKKYKLSVFKSKGSTTAIMNGNTTKPKKKHTKQPNNNKKMSGSRSRSKKNSKSNKMFIFFKDPQKDDKSQSEQQYPTNKYISMKKTKKNLSIKVGPLGPIGVQYQLNGANVMSVSLIDEIADQSSQKVYQIRNSQNKISASNSLNVEEIKYFEQNSPLRNKIANKSQIFRKIVCISKQRLQIQGFLGEQYPYLDSKQLNFLSAVVFIQRKWRLTHNTTSYRSDVLLTQYLQQEQKQPQKILLNLTPTATQNKQEITSYKDHLKTYKNSSKSFQATPVNLKIMKEKPAQNNKIEEKVDAKVEERVEGSSDKHTELDHVDDNQTYKNSPSQNIIIYSSSAQHSPSATPSATPSPNTYRKIPQHISNTHPALPLIQQNFPQITYLQYKSTFIHEECEKLIKDLQNQKNNSTISSQQFYHKKVEIILHFKRELSNLKKIKHDIKKGYLKYIQCLNTVKGWDGLYQETNQQKFEDVPLSNGKSRTRNKFGLRKVSSHSNFVSNLYDKIFKFDQCLSEWSGGSESIQMLTKRILIRKQFYLQNSNREHKSRRSGSDLRSAGRSSFQLIRSSRDANHNTIIVFQHTPSLENLGNTEKFSKQNEQNDKNIREFQFSSELFQNSKDIPKNKLLQNVQIPIKTQQNVSRPTAPIEQTLNLSNSMSLIQSKQLLLTQIQNLLLIDLAKDLQKDIHRINPVLMDIILVNQADKDLLNTDNYQNEIQQNQFVANNWQDDDDRLPVTHKNDGQFINFNTQREYHSQMYSQNVINYIQGLICYIQVKNWAQGIIQHLNYNQSFSAQTYLKFLRDFELPNEQYIPIISNSQFIEWQNFYNKNNKKRTDFDKQCTTIFHRCIFEVFITQLQKHKPYGQKGQPFPWQQNYSKYYNKYLYKKQTSIILKKCLIKIQQLLSYCCGFIEQKAIILTQQELQKQYENNQDRIICMLEQDLNQSSHNWYQVQQHGLEIKLDLSVNIQEIIFHEFIEELVGVGVGVGVGQILKKYG